MMEAVRTSETTVYFDETTRRYIPESCHLELNYLFIVDGKVEGQIKLQKSEQCKLKLFSFVHGKIKM
jgi:hypothetical protein